MALPCMLSLVLSLSLALMWPSGVLANGQHPPGTSTPEVP
jgi:hypothetical protein